MFAAWRLVPLFAGRCYNKVAMAAIVRKIFKTGHSAALTLSKKCLAALGLKVGDDVKIELDETKQELVIGPGKRQNQLSLNLKARPRLGQKAN